jgi:hypothetical protein
MVHRQSFSPPGAGRAGGVVLFQHVRLFAHLVLLRSSHGAAYRGSLSQLGTVGGYHRGDPQLGDGSASKHWSEHTGVPRPILCSASRDALGRLVLGWIPVMVFSVIGFEHTVANMASIPIAMMYGAPISVNQYIANSPAGLSGSSSTLYPPKHGPTARVNCACMSSTTPNPRGGM